MLLLKKFKKKRIGGNTGIQCKDKIRGVVEVKEYVNSLIRTTR
jgi:hypothetical protein